MKRLAIISCVLFAIVLYLVMPVGATTVELNTGYARIDSYAGYHSFSAWGEGWASFAGIPDFESNSGSFVSHNTDSIRTSLRSSGNSYDPKSSLYFETSGPVVIGQSYSALTNTDIICDGHMYSHARFDWTTDWSYGPSSDYLRLELWASRPDGTYGPVWAVQPGGGLYSGHVDMVLPLSYSLGFRVSAVDPSTVPEPSSITGLALALPLLIGFAIRRK